MDETIRHYLKRRIRWAFAIGICGWLMFSFSAAVFGPQKDAAASMTLIMQIAGVAMFGGAILVMARTKCPKCSVTLGQVGSSIAIPFVKQPNFCPYCGVSFDEPHQESEPHKLIS
jgi:hypothetical protein